MAGFTTYLAAAASIGALAAPAAAQYYPQQYPQTYPPQQYPQQQYPQQTYPQQQTYPGQPYGYGQAYPGNPVTDIIDQLLGNRYSVTDRQAVRQCANAARTQAQSQYGGYAYGQGQGYPQGYGYNQAFAAPAMHVTSVTSVEHRSNGLRVRGTLGTGYSGQYGNHYGYPGQAYGNQYGNAYGNAYAAGDLPFRCNVDYRGVVTDVRVGGTGYRRY
jgi:hypothetical protein